MTVYHFSWIIVDNSANLSKDAPHIPSHECQTSRQSNYTLNLWQLLQMCEKVKIRKKNLRNGLCDFFLQIWYIISLIGWHLHSECSLKDHGATNILKFIRVNMKLKPTILNSSKHAECCALTMLYSNITLNGSFEALFREFVKEYIMT